MTLLLLWCEVVDWTLCDSYWPMTQYYYYCEGRYWLVLDLLLTMVIVDCYYYWPVIVDWTQLLLLTDRPIDGRWPAQTWLTAQTGQLIDIGIVGQWPSDGPLLTQWPMTQLLDGGWTQARTDWPRPSWRPASDWPDPVDPDGQLDWPRWRQAQWPSGDPARPSPVRTRTAHWWWLTGGQTQPRPVAQLWPDPDPLKLDNDPDDQLLTQWPGQLTGGPRRTIDPVGRTDDPVTQPAQLVLAQLTQLTSPIIDPVTWPIDREPEARRTKLTSRTQLKLTDDGGPNWPMTQILWPDDPIVVCWTVLVGRLKAVEAVDSWWQASPVEPSQLLLDNDPDGQTASYWLTVWYWTQTLLLLDPVILSYYCGQLLAQ